MNTLSKILVEKDSNITSYYYESEFYPSNKQCDIESPLVNESDNKSNLTYSLNDLTMCETSNSGISNLTIINNNMAKVRLTVLYHNPDHDSWNKGIDFKQTRKSNLWFNKKDIIQDEYITVNFSKIKRRKNIEKY